MKPLSFIEKLTNYFNAGYPCLVITTVEEKKAQDDILEAVKCLNERQAKKAEERKQEDKPREKQVITWAASEGVKALTSTEAEPNTEMPEAALRFIIQAKYSDTIIIFRDIHTWKVGDDPIVSRLLREVITEAPAEGCNVVLLAPEFRPYSSIEKLCTVMEYSLPDEITLAEIAENLRLNTMKASNTEIKPADQAVIKALSGLSTAEAENALSLSLVEAKEFVPAIIYREKVAAVKRSGLLSIIDPDPAGLDALGGLENLKEWILIRKKAFSPAAQKYGLPMPKGVLVCGPAGCGKSQFAKIVGTALDVPCVHLDVASMFRGIVGETEQIVRQTLELAEAISPCVLFIDELEKALAGGTSGSGDNDSGVARRMFGSLLTWMQDKKKPVFVVATANEIDGLPAPLLRKGRFDEIFTVDLPHPGERAEIAAVILKRRGRDPKGFDLTKMAEYTPKFIGAEIESVIDGALIRAFNDGEREPTTEDLLAAAKDIIPISKTAEKSIEAIREWGKGRAKPASKAPTAVAPTAASRKLKV